MSASSSAKGDKDKSKLDGRRESLNSDEVRLKTLMEFFMKTKDKDLLEHRKCISSTINSMEQESALKSINGLQPVMLVEKGGYAIACFKKPSKS